MTGLKPTQKEINSFVDAAGYGRFDQVVDFVEKYPRVIDAQCVHGNTALLFSVFMGERAIAQYLLNKGANVNVAGDDGDTPLMAAAAQGSVVMVRLLLEYRADVALKDANGKTARMMAAVSKRSGAQAVIALIDEYADKNSSAAREKKMQNKAADNRDVLRRRKPESPFSKKKGPF